MSDGVLIERDGRLEFYTQPAAFGYIIDHPRRIQTYRRMFAALPIVSSVALLGFRPHRMWTSLIVIVVSFIGADLLRRMLFLRSLPRTEDRLGSLEWRRESVQQGSVYFAIVLPASLALTVIAAGMTVSASRSGALIRYGVAYSVMFAMLRILQLRERRRLFRRES